MRLRATFRTKYVISDHIWVVAYYRDNVAITFNFTTHQPSFIDTACIVTPAQHRDLRYDSVIAYQHGILWKDEALGMLETDGVDKYLANVSPEVLRQIQAGAIESPFTPNEQKDLIRSELNI